MKLDQYTMNFAANVDTSVHSIIASAALPAGNGFMFAGNFKTYTDALGIITTTAANSAVYFSPIQGYNSLHTYVPFATTTSLSFDSNDPQASIAFI